MGRARPTRAARGRFAGEHVEDGAVRRREVLLRDPLDVGVGHGEVATELGAEQFGVTPVHLELGQALRPLQNGNVQHYLYAVALGLLALGTFGMFAQ